MAAQQVHSESALAPSTFPQYIPRIPFAPLTPSQRLVQLDFLRGVALLGVFLVNAAFFFGTLGRALDSSWTAHASTIDRVAWSFVSGICTFKFISLFSMMFGYGVALQMLRASEAGRSRTAFAIRRFGFLVLMGAVHGILMWHGDILFIYGVLGFAIALLAQAPAKVIFIFAACIGAAIALFTTVGVATMLLMPEGGSFGAMPEMQFTQDQIDSARGFKAIQDSGYYNFMTTVWQAAEARAFSEGPWLDATTFRAFNWFIAASVAPLGYGWQVLFMMLLGVGAMKIRFWDAEQARVRSWVATIGLGVGLPISLGGVAVVWATDFKVEWAWVLHDASTQLGAMLLPPAYAVVIAASAARLPHAIVGAVAAAGRMPLTTYLSETLCATAVSYWWGLGWFGKLGAAQQLLTVFCIWVGLVVVARTWLSVFPMGPMEWIWRVVSYASPHPERATSRSSPRAG
jgi:uncharacterized protein